jgi:hypothetical protein
MHLKVSDPRPLHLLPSQVMAALEQAAKVPKSPVSELFSDVYREVPWHLQEQLEQVLATARRHPELCPPDMELR